MAGGLSATPAEIARVRAELHLNDPLLVQYWHWLTKALHGNSGHVPLDGPVGELSDRHSVPGHLRPGRGLVDRLTHRRDPAGHHFGHPAPRCDRQRCPQPSPRWGWPIPSFWLAIILVSVFAVHWKILPPTGYTAITTSFTGWLRDMILPAVTLGLLVGATLARQLRASLIDVLETPYVRTAWAKGGTRRAVLLRHGLKNASMPVVTVFGLQIGYLLGGAVIVEQIFSIPGLGTYMLSGITDHDLPVVQGVAIVFVLFQMAMSLIADISYGYLNPKVRVA